MGCGSSSYTKTVSKHQGSSTNAMTTDVIVLKDMPEVVEKLIDVIKDTDAEMVTKLTTDPKFEYSSTETILNDTLSGTDSGSSLQGYVQGFLADNSSINLSETVQEDIENSKVEDNSLPDFRDFDSLNTSSPESEIEQALANNNSLNPPTPKPNLFELQEMYVLPTSNIDLETTSNNPVKDNHCANNSANTPVILSEPTDWEKQADMLANIIKYNPIEAMRKLKRESTRASSSLPHRDLKPRSHCVEENLIDFISQNYNQIPLQSGTSSAKRGTGPTIPSTTDTVAVSEKNDRSNNKTQDVSIKKHDDTSRKVISSSLNNFKVRNRCAVCCNKYKT